MLFSVGSPVWETTFINPHGCAFPLSSHRMLQGWYLQQDAETPCPRHGAQSSCKWSALFYPPVTLIQQGALQLWGIFCPYCSKPELRGLKLGSRRACSPVTRHENVPHQEFRRIFLPVQRDGVKDLLPPTRPPPKREHFVVPLSFPHFHINPEASLNLQPLGCFLFSAPTATGEIPVSPKPHKAASQLGYAPGPLHWDVLKRDLCKNFC